MGRCRGINEVIAAIGKLNTAEPLKPGVVVRRALGAVCRLGGVVGGFVVLWGGQGVVGWASRGLGARGRGLRRRLGRGVGAVEEAKEVLRAVAPRVGVWRFTWGGGEGMVGLGWEGEWDEEMLGVVAVAAGVVAGAQVQRWQAWEQGETYRRIFRNSKDMVYLSSRDGRWLEVNPAGVEMLGYDSAEELLSRPDGALASYVNPEDRKRFMEAVEREGFVKDYEVSFRRKNGSRIEVSITGQVRREQGRVVGYEGIIKDITARKEAEYQAARDRKLLESILEVMPVAVFVVDRNHRVTHWNRACEELTRVRKEEILGTDRTWEVFQRPKGVSLADVLVEQDIELLKRIYGRERLRRSPVSEDAWEAEAHFENLGGRPKDLFFTAAALRDDRGEVVGAVEAIIDMTYIKDLERQLAASEDLYRTLVESNSDGIVLQGEEGFIFANRAFLKLFGLESLEEAGGDFLELLVPACRRAYLKWQQLVAEGRAEGCTFEGQGIRGPEAFDLEITATHTQYRGKPAVLFTVRDVEQRKRMEEQLIRSERLAATGKLAFDIAHEVNNPLGGILAYAHLLAEDLGEEHPLRETVEKIIKLTNRCRIIVRGLLDFAREDAPEREALNVNEVVEEMLGLMEGHVILREVEIVKDYAPDLPDVYGHRSKLEQVFLNLVVNAAEAMGGRGRLEIRTYAREGRVVCVEVKDNGPGMPEEVARRVFEPFFTTKERGRGTGLGLAISHGIITQHGGRIELSTRPGEGTTFTVLLPAAGRSFT